MKLDCVDGEQKRKSEERERGLDRHEYETRRNALLIAHHT
jgi:hypothetical protein